jgi:hypothetical protein
VELARLLDAPRAGSVALVVDAENIGSRQVWLPEWGGNSGDTIPARRGRTVYIGLEMSLGPRIGSRASATP